MGHIVVFGNEKGGSGKSTAAMHAIIALLRLGYNVGSIDLDARQGTLTRYLANRFEWEKQGKYAQTPNDPSAASLSSTPASAVLPPPLMPTHMPIVPANQGTLEERQKQDSDFFFMALAELGPICDFIVIDTPGADTHLSRLAHRFADTLVTPMNDSLIDLDLLATHNPNTLEISDISYYARHIMHVRNRRKTELGLPFRWIVMRNRMNHLNQRSKREIDTLLSKLSPMLGFQYIHGFSERLIFRDMFLRGQTVLDLAGASTGENMTNSELSARHEVRLLTHAIVPPEMRVVLMKRKKAQTNSA